VLAPSPAYLITYRKFHLMHYCSISIELSWMTREVFCGNWEIANQQTKLMVMKHSPIIIYFLTNDD